MRGYTYTFGMVELILACKHRPKVEKQCIKTWTFGVACVAPGLVYCIFAINFLDFLLQVIALLTVRLRSLLPLGRGSQSSSVYF